MASAGAARLLLFLQPEHVHVAAAPPQPDQVAAAPRPPGRALPQRSGQSRQTLRRVFRLLLLRRGRVSASVYRRVRINAPVVAGTRRFVSQVFHATGSAASAGAQAPQPPRNIEKAPTQNLCPGGPECTDSKANSHVFCKHCNFVKWVGFTQTHLKSKVQLLPPYPATIHTG